MRTTRSALVAQRQWQAGHPAASARRTYPQPRRRLPVARVARWTLAVVAVLVALPYTGLV